jgi:hypothetical protein
VRTLIVQQTAAERVFMAASAVRRSIATVSGKRRIAMPNPTKNPVDRSAKDEAATKRKSATPVKPATPRPEVDSMDANDPVDQASYDSFPASDPPAHSSNRAMPGAKRER